MGDKNKIVHEYTDGTLEKIMRDVDSGRLKGRTNWFAEHPAYFGTSIQQKDARKENRCRKCVYFDSPVEGRKKACTFPFSHPKDYDTVNIKFLPCKGIRP